MSGGYGQHYQSMYTGSMVGSGAMVYAVMGYVIANASPKTHEVELNTVLLATILGEPEEAVKKTIFFLCSPDPRSRTKKADGRRLVKRGEYNYFVVNHKHYMELLRKERRNEYMAELMARTRNANKVLTGANSPVVVDVAVVDSASVPEGSAEGRDSSPPWSRELFDKAAVSAGVGVKEAEACWCFYDSQGWVLGNGRPITGDPRSLLVRWSNNPQRGQVVSVGGNGDKTERKLTPWEIKEQLEAIPKQIKAAKDADDWDRYKKLQQRQKELEAMRTGL